MTNYVFHAERLTDSERLAQLLAAVVKPNTLIALDGDLGAGKTTFCQMLASALGVREIVNSPTFTIIKEYEAAELPFYHMDVYRLDATQADQLGLDDYFFGGGVTLVEWASLIEALLPPDYLHISIDMQETVDGPSARQFVLQPYGPNARSWCEQWLAQGYLKVI